MHIHIPIPIPIPIPYLYQYQYNTNTNYEKTIPGVFLDTDLNENVKNKPISDFYVNML